MTDRRTRQTCEDCDTSWRDPWRTACPDCGGTNYVWSDRRDA